jgi:hypothetical protein
MKEETDMLPEFHAYRKIARLSREIIIEEKIDGTNGVVHVADDGTVTAGSRSRWLTANEDNFGFAAWVAENADELRKLGPGYHYGEWWGKGIQRNYGQNRRRFSLFNVFLGDDRPACCDLVPVLYEGPFTTGAIDACLEDLAWEGSKAAPGFMKPEGVVVFHRQGNVMFKKTLEGDCKGV